jgi:hypothetical protein
MALPSYEDTALAGQLTPEQQDALIAAFVKDSDVTLIAHELDMPRELVLAALEDGSLAERALAAKRSAAACRFMGLAIDQLTTVLETPLAMSSGAEKISAIKLLHNLLGLRPAAPPRALAAPKEPKSADKPRQGALEAALAEDYED